MPWSRSWASPSNARASVAATVDGQERGGVLTSERAAEWLGASPVRGHGVDEQLWRLLSEPPADECGPLDVGHPGVVPGTALDRGGDLGRAGSLTGCHQSADQLGPELGKRHTESRRVDPVPARAQFVDGLAVPSRSLGQQRARQHRAVFAHLLDTRLRGGVCRGQVGPGLGQVVAAHCDQGENAEAHRRPRWAVAEQREAGLDLGDRVVPFADQEQPVGVHDVVQRQDRLCAETLVELPAAVQHLEAFGHPISGDQHQTGCRGRQLWPVWQRLRIRRLHGLHAQFGRFDQVPAEGEDLRFGVQVSEIATESPVGAASSTACSASSSAGSYWPSRSRASAAQAWYSARSAWDAVRCASASSICTSDSAT